MGEALVVTSGKGGAGKSTVAVNLAAALAMKGKSALLIDAVADPFHAAEVDIYGNYKRK